MTLEPVKIVKNNLGMKLISQVKAPIKFVSKRVEK